MSRSVSDDEGAHGIDILVDADLRGSKSRKQAVAKYLDDILDWFEVAHLLEELAVQRLQGRELRTCRGELVKISELPAGVGDVRCALFDGTAEDPLRQMRYWGFTFDGRWLIVTVEFERRVPGGAAWFKRASAHYTETAQEISEVMGMTPVKMHLEILNLLNKRIGRLQERLEYMRDKFDTVKEAWRFVQRQAIRAGDGEDIYHADFDR